MPLSIWVMGWGQSMLSLPEDCCIPAADRNNVPNYYILVIWNPKFIGINILRNLYSCLISRKKYNIIINQYIKLKSQLKRNKIFDIVQIDNKHSQHTFEIRLCRTTQSHREQELLDQYHNKFY